MEVGRDRRTGYTRHIWQDKHARAAIGSGGGGGVQVQKSDREEKVNAATHGVYDRTTPTSEDCSGKYSKEQTRPTRSAMPGYAVDGTKAKRRMPGPETARCSSLHSCA